MEENTPYSDLKAAITKLENEQAVSAQLLKDEFRATYESLNPFNIIKRSFSDFIESSEIKNDLAGLIMPLITGFFIKKLASGTGRGQAFRQAGVLFLDGLGRYIVNNPAILKSIGQVVTNVFRRGKTQETSKD